jgi:hypothetical protein
MFWFVGSEKLEARNPQLKTATEQPLWKPAQPESKQPLDSIGPVLFFLPRLFGKTIFSELHSGQRSILPGMRVVSTDSQEIGN